MPPRAGDRAEAIAAGIGEPPPLDLTLRDPTETWRGPTSSVASASPRPSPPAARHGRHRCWQVTPRVRGGAGPRRVAARAVAGAVRGGGRSTCARRPAERRCNSRAKAGKSPRSTSATSGSTGCARDLARTGLAAKIWIADALTWEPAEPFDAILLDAPCTASGTCRRHPDVFHRIGPRQIAEMAELQARLLERAQRWLSPGASCLCCLLRLENVEGEHRAAMVELEPLPITSDELPAGLSRPRKAGCARSPGMLAEHGGLDGFSSRASSDKAWLRRPRKAPRRAPPAGR